MEPGIAVFGAALEALPSPERINIKIAYLDYLARGGLKQEGFSDPFDFAKTCIRENTSLGYRNNRVKWAGRFSLPSWLTPKPTIADRSKLTVQEFDTFLKGDGCWKQALRVADYINEEIRPRIPFMIGVDHSLTGGSLMALSSFVPNLNLVILDAHFDALKARRAFQSDGGHEERVYDRAQDGTFSYDPLSDYYECGNFLDRILENGIVAPRNVWILGLQDELCRELGRIGDFEEHENVGILPVKKWIDKGVHVVFKKELGSVRCDLNGPTYISIDMDVGSLSSIYSARFMNSRGLSRDAFLRILHDVFEALRSSNSPLAGIDIMETDIHFLEIANETGVADSTGEIIKEVFNILMN